MAPAGAAAATMLIAIRAKNVRRCIITILRDQVDLDQRVLHEQAGAADRGAWRRRRKVALPDRVEAVEVAEVGQEDLGLDDLVQRRAGGLERLPQVLQNI